MRDERNSAHLVHPVIPSIQYVTESLSEGAYCCQSTATEARCQLLSCLPRNPLARTLPRACCFSLRSTGSDRGPGASPCPRVQEQRFRPAQYSDRPDYFISVSGSVWPRTRRVLTWARRGPIFCWWIGQAGAPKGHEEDLAQAFDNN